MTQELHAKGWCRFGFDDEVMAWVTSALPTARALAADPEHVRAWLRCGGTWFAGVNLLPNQADGSIEAGPPLKGAPMRAISESFGPQSLDKAQISVIYPGYPRAMDGESEAAFIYRQRRDAAHVDGLLPEGLERRRHLREPHGFVLGLPLTQSSEAASPMVVWEGSHKIMRRAFQKALQGVSPERWGDVDLTEIYHAARRTCFNSCPRKTVHAGPGESYLVHRLTLHGVAPWGEDAQASPEGRMIAYFRPHLADVADWLD